MPELSFEAMETQNSCAVLLPHATIAVSYESKKLEHRSLLLYKMSLYEYAFGRYQDACQHALQSCEESLKVHGETSSKTLKRKLHLARTMLGVGKDDERQKLMKELKGEIENSRSDVNKPEANVAYRSAHELWETGRQDAAFRGFQRALTLYQAVHDPEAVILCLNRLADIAKTEGQLEESESLYRRAMQESINTYPENHPEIFVAMNNVGRCVQQRGRIAEAGEFFRLILRGKDEAYGMRHPETIEAMRQLMENLKQESKLDEAEILARRILEFNLEKRELDHPNTKLAVSNLSSILWDLKRVQEAIEVDDIIFLTIKDVPTRDLVRRACMLSTQGNLLEAEHMYRKALEKSQEQLGHDHPDNLDLLKNLADCLEKQDKWEAAEVQRRQILEFHEKNRGEEDAESIGFQAEAAAVSRARDQLLQSLFFRDILVRHDQVSKAFEGTYEWIFADSETSDKRRWSSFHDWLMTGDDIYWISGKPGSGKSTLMKYIISQERTLQLLNSWSEGREIFLISFFFWKAGSALQNSITGFLRSVLYQVAIEWPELVELLTKRDVKVLGGTQFPQNLHAFATWIDERLLSCLKLFLERKPSTFDICIFLDGLDEFTGNEEFLLDIVRILGKTSRCKVCVTSRPEQAFRQNFRLYPQLRMQDLNDEDIKRTAADRLRPHLERFPKSEVDIDKARSMMDSIKDTVISLLGSNGRKLKVVIQWEVLRCLHEQYDSNPDLHNLMVIAGEPCKAWTTTCSDYFDNTWPETGASNLTVLADLLSKTSQASSSRFNLSPSQTSSKPNFQANCIGKYGELVRG